MVRKVFYEDDLAVSVVDASKGIKFYRKLRFVSGGFNLLKFRTNGIDVKRVFNSNEVKFDAEEQGKVLG